MMMMIMIIWMTVLQETRFTKYILWLSELYNSF
jgi:hypothetical protein